MQMEQPEIEKPEVIYCEPSILLKSKECHSQDEIVKHMTTLEKKAKGFLLEYKDKIRESFYEAIERLHPDFVLTPHDHDYVSLRLTQAFGDKVLKPRIEWTSLFTEQSLRAKETVNRVFKDVVFGDAQACLVIPSEPEEIHNWVYKTRDGFELMPSVAVKVPFSVEGFAQKSRSFDPTFPLVGDFEYNLVVSIHRDDRQEFPFNGGIRYNRDRVWDPESAKKISWYLSEVGISSRSAAIREARNKLGALSGGIPGSKG